MKSVAAFWTWGGRVSKTCVRAYVCRCHACIYLLAKEGDLEMLVEDVSPASDQPQSWDVGRPLATLVTLECWLSPTTAGKFRGVQQDCPRDTDRFLRFTCL
eukprot:scaffold72171_cov24-Tisochrysis_lutea.AAC.1